MKNFVPNYDKSNILYNKFLKIYDEDPLRFNSLPGITINWNAVKLMDLYLYVSGGCSETQQEVAELLGVERSTISRKANGMDWEKFETILEGLITSDKDEAIAFEASLVKEKKKEKQLEQKRKRIIDRQALYQTIIEDIRNAKTPTIILPNCIQKTKTNGDEHVILLLSDWHVGQEFSLAETGGINEYNLDIFKRRAANLRDAVIEITKLHSTLYPLPTLHIFALGDMVQGANANGEWGTQSNSHLHVQAQAKIVASTISQLIQEWAKYYKTIEFNGVIGNHGRGGATKNSDPLGANWDNVAYEYVAREYKNNTRVSVYDTIDSWYLQKKVKNTEFMIMHGDFLKGGINSLFTEEQKVRSITSKTQKVPYDVLCLGHFHTNIDLETSKGRILVNGSMVGGDIHSLHHMRLSGEPTQKIMGVNEKGITWSYWLELEGRRSNSSNKPIEINNIGVNKYV